jgi:hypothetical protein
MSLIRLLEQPVCRWAGGLPVFAQFGDVHVAEVGENERTRDRCRAEHQHIDRIAFLRQCKPFAYAEAMLLIDNGQRQVLEDHIVLDQRVGADQKIDLAICESGDDLAAFLAFLASGKNGDIHSSALGERRDGLDVLARENFRRRHQRGLLAGFRHGGGGEQRHHRLA